MSDEPDSYRTDIGAILLASHQGLRSYWAQIEEERRNRPPSGWEIEAMTVRGTVTEKLLGGSHYGSAGPMPEKLTEAIAWLQDYLKQVPKSLRATAKFEIESEGGYEGDHHVELTITYQRPETDEEWAARRADVERRRALAAQRQETEERAQFERLKAKFT